jgi:hypothetical protein
MGSCQTSEVIEAPSNKSYKSKKKNYSEDPIDSILDQQKNEFPDMPEWDGDRYTGIGIKKMKGYKCDLPIDKLNKKRDEFWDLKNSRDNENYKIWRVINQACVYDELRANMLLEEYGLTTESGCINHIIDQDGNHYHIPNYCINDPFFERQYKVKKNIEEKKVKIKLFEPTGNINEEQTVNNTITGKELKELFKKEHNIGDNFNLRLFFGGMEIKDDHFLYQHHLKNGYKIQVMKLPKIDSTPSQNANNNNDKKSKKKAKKKKKKVKKNKEEEKEEAKNSDNNSEIEDEED